jgi:hypothetical protein
LKAELEGDSSSWFADLIDIGASLVPLSGEIRKFGDPNKFFS